jgi:hypothetical protein
VRVLQKCLRPHTVRDKNFGIAQPERLVIFGTGCVLQKLGEKIFGTGCVLQKLDEKFLGQAVHCENLKIFLRQALCVTKT